MERNIFIRLRIENAERLLETTGESASEIMCRGGILESAKRVHLCLPNSKLLLIENAGHFPWPEQPDASFSDVPVFLQALNQDQEP